MKMERTDVAVGLVTCIALVVVAGVVIWLARGGREETYELYTQFADIAGVAPQAPVFLRGYEIGRVRDIQPLFTETGPLFVVRMDVRWQLAGSNTRTTLPRGTTALLRPPPLIGTATIELEIADEPGMPLLEPGDTIIGRAERTLAQQASSLGGGLVFDAGETMAAARDMLVAITAASASAQQLLEATSTGVPDVMARVSGQLEATAALTEELRLQVGTLTPALARTVDSLNALVGDSRMLVGRITESVDVAQPDLAAIIANLERTSLVLEHFTREVAQRPTRLLTGVAVPSADSLRAILPAPPSRTSARRIPPPGG
jgi:ABC-type transporter Mla subunit MlaD